MLETRMINPIKLGPWPDMATARLFLSQMASSDVFSQKLPDPGQLADWLKQIDLNAFAYMYFKQWDNPTARTIVKHLEISYWADVAAASIKLAALEQILKYFTVNDIDCTLVKGIAFGLTIYSEHAVRSMNDIDLWIQKRDLPAVWEIFKEMGYRDKGVWPDPLSVADYTAEISFYPDDPETAKWNIDVHWDLLSRPGLIGRLPLDAWWQRRQSMQFRGMKIMVLNPADALVHVCAHQMLQHRGELLLRWLLDIDRLVRGQGTYVILPAHWQRLRAELRDSEIRPAIHTSMRLAARWFTTPLSDEVQQLFSEPFSSKQNRLFLSYAVPHMSGRDRAITNLRWAKSFQQKVQMALRFLFPRPGYMIERYQISSRVFLPLYYLGRLLKGVVILLRGH